jgi:hypothetical protein
VNRWRRARAAAAAAAAARERDRGELIGEPTGDGLQRRKLRTSRFLQVEDIRYLFWNAADSPTRRRKLFSSSSVFELNCSSNSVLQI